jgi:hypothetical protein
MQNEKTIKERIKSIPILGSFFISAWSFILRQKERKYLNKNSKLKNSFISKRCFILATGPSIKKQDLKKLKGELVITVSNFFVHPDFREISPEFHLFVPNHQPATDDQIGAWWKEAEKAFPAGQKVLISITDKPIVLEFNLFKNQDVYYYQPGQKYLRPNQEIDFEKSLPITQTSVHIAIYLAFYLGVKEIYLLGCDHDWILHLGESRHFYEEKKSVLSEKGYDEWAGKDLEMEFQAYANLWKIYKKIKSYAEKRGISIVNSTLESLLDIFPKKSFEKIQPN